MKKTTVVAAVTAGLAGFTGLHSAQAQTPPTPSDVSPAPAGQAPGTAPPGEPPAEPAPAPAPASAPAPEPTPAPIEKTPTAAGQSKATLFPSPALDSNRLEQQGEEEPRKAGTSTNGSASAVFAEDWWSHARPVFEFHGYFRTRASLFHNFALSRLDPPNQALYPQPSDNQYQSLTTSFSDVTTREFVGPELCTSDNSSRPVTQGSEARLRPCENKSQVGANMRFRLEPTLHVSDNLRINSQIDLLDNVVFGSTPEGYAFGPSAGGGYSVSGRTGSLAQGYLDDTVVPPTSGVNGLEDSIRVKRAWAEFSTPLGELRFGRMPNHWGLGMVANAGNGPDDDAQSTVDRIMFASGIKLLDLTIAGMVDFPNEGPTYRASYTGSDPYDRSQLDDVDQYGLILMRSKSPELTKLALSQGNWVVNGGLYLNYRSQVLANDQAGSVGANLPDATNEALASTGFTRRGMNAWRPDLWVQLLHDKLRIEVEAAAVLGHVDSTSIVSNNTADFADSSEASRAIRQFGLAFELQQKMVEDRLRLNFHAGWASGDADTFDPATPGDLVPSGNEQQVNDRVLSAFQFHPGYRTDLILNRYILNRIQSSYYFNPSLDYDFTRQPNGQRLGGGISANWTRAQYAVQTPGHDSNLGIELGGSLFFQSKDGALNDDPDGNGGFFGKLEYAVLFPLDGLGYQAQLPAQELSAAQALRLYLGAQF